MGWAANADMEKRVKTVVRQRGLELDTDDLDLVYERIIDSKFVIISALSRRGYELSTIEAWPLLSIFQLDIGLWRALQDLGVKRGDEEDWIEIYNRLDELDDILLTDAGGTPVSPGEEVDDGTTVFAAINADSANIDIGISGERL